MLSIIKINKHDTGESVVPRSSVNVFGKVFWWEDVFFNMKIQ